MTPPAKDLDSGASAGGGSGGEPTSEPDIPVVNPLPACVPVSVDGGTQASECPALNITIDPNLHGPVCAPGGFTIEPLQVPDFSPGVLRDLANPPLTEPDPSKWDRSVLPAGAYVVRLHGLRASCYPGGGHVYLGSCAENPTVSPGSFYEKHCSTAPGCSTAEKIAYSGSTDGSDDSGYWWYLDDVGDSAMDLVVCAPEVPSYAYGACLKLDPNLACTLR